jgi:Icc-related predicted phosphoesterase
LIRVAAVGDLHCDSDSPGRIRPIFAGINSEADLLILTGDLTNSGEVYEAELLIEELRDITIPIVAILGNHDYESDKQHEIAQVLRDHKIIVLDGEHVTLNFHGQTVGIGGLKGFAGGFSKHMVAAFGERQLKDFVHVGLREAYKLETSLNALDTDFRVVALHYSPIRDTMIGESLEVFPFLGSSALCYPIDKLGADVVFHAHAHYGSRLGQTESGIRVYNVARPIIQTYVIHELG